MSVNFLFPNIFSLRAIFVRSFHIFLILFRKMFYNFALKLNMANPRHVFSALGPETEAHIKQAKDQIRFDL